MNAVLINPRRSEELECVGCDVDISKSRDFFTLLI